MPPAFVPRVRDMDPELYECIRSPVNFTDYGLHDSLDHFLIEQGTSFYPPRTLDAFERVILERLYNEELKEKKSMYILARGLLNETCQLKQMVGILLLHKNNL